MTIKSFCKWIIDAALWAILILVARVALAADAAPSTNAESKHLTTEQQRDIAELLGDLATAQLALDRQTAAVNKKVEELKAACGGELIRDAKGHYDCAPAK